jgi:hypothetical protein
MIMRANVARMMDPVIEVLLFSVGGVRYGVPLGQVVGLVKDLEAATDAPRGAVAQMLLFEGIHVPVLPADDFIQEMGPRVSRGREAIIFDNGTGPYGVFVDAVHYVVEAVPGNDLYVLPPTEGEDPDAPRAWGVLTVAERPVLLLDLSHASMH